MRGSRIGDRYRVDTLLAEGGMGRVWRCHDEQSGDVVVIKQVRAPGDTRLRRMFGRELRTIARFEHPNIVSVRDVGRTDDGALWYAMDRVNGEPLHRWAARPRTWAEIAIVLDDVLAALAHAHARDVLHLDVKPENILVDRNGRASLVDFGVSRLLAPSVDVLDGVGPRALRPLPGTPAWMAPEQIRGDEHLLGPATDLYALGCVLVELVTGRHPWPAASAEAWMLRHLTAPLPALATPDGDPLPAELVGIVRDMLERHARARAWQAAGLRLRLRHVPAFDLRTVGSRSTAAMTTADTLDTSLESNPAPRETPAPAAARTLADTLKGPTPFATTLASTLVHLRATPLIGHELQSGAIRADLVRALKSDAGSVHVVEGSADVGARAIARHLARRMAETGSARRIAATETIRFGVPGSRMRAALGRVVGFRSAKGPRLVAWLADHVGTTDLADVRPMVDWLDRRLPPGTRAEHAASTHAALASRLLQVVAADTPALIIIDDAERIEDPVDLAVLCALARATEGPRVHLLFATPSLDALHPDLRAALDAASRPGRTHTHHITAPATDDAIELCGSLLPMSEAAAEAFVRHIGAAPVALHRGIVEAVDERVLVDRGGTWHLAGHDAEAWLADLAQARAVDRLDRLMSDAQASRGLGRAGLSGVALLDEVATDATVAKLLALRGLNAPASAVGDAIDRAVRRDVLLETPTGSLRFAQQTTADHVIARLEPSAVDAWRCDAVRVLESHIDRPGVDAIVALHRIHIGDDGAAATVVAAARAALDRGHRRVAARLVDELDAACGRPANDSDTALALARLDTRIAWTGSDHPRLARACAALDVLAREPGGQAARAWALDARGRDALMHASPAEASYLLARASDAHDFCGHADDARRARLALADAWRRMSRYDDAEAVCWRLLAEADDAKRLDDAIETLNVLAFLALETARYPEALEITADALGRIASTTPRHHLARARKLRAGALLRTGREDDALDEARAALALVHVLGDRVEEAALHNLIGMCQFELEAWGGARASGLAALDISEAIDERHLRGRILNNLALACDRLGRKREADRYFEDAIVWSARCNDLQNEARTLYNLARRLAPRDPGMAAALGWRATTLLRGACLPYADAVEAWIETLDDSSDETARARTVDVLYRAWGARDDEPSPL